ncbi:hypothetical protein OUZ56_010915 [Daphnia magna]|uniref:Proteasome-associated protein ECM29 n=1 Tax=Daphnia magna TaxID=35525 RepID=A0ABQ9YYR6_9CRUS|nr:hypothetical protein OUZ56_010915 [Daphnia magna]
MDDLALLERVFLRVGSADTDEKLEAVILKFLCPVLLKLTSTEENVRKKVMELLVHFNKRVKSRPNLQLPVVDLMILYQDPSCSIFLSNFAIIYIKMGFPRLDVARQAELLPQLFNSIHGKPLQHQDSLLFIALPALAHANLSTEVLKQPYLFLQEKVELAKYIRDFFLDIVLLPYGLVHPSANPTTPSNPPPGMSEYGWKRSLGEVQLKAEQLEETKLGIVKFVSSGIFGEQNIVPHLVVAAADTRFSVANAADSALKRIGGTVDWNDVAVITVLYQLFLGTRNSKENIKPEFRRVPACTRLRLKLFTYLIRSREASTQFPACIQLTFEGLFGENSNAKLKVMALQFLHQMLSNCPVSRLSPISPVLISGLMKIINDTQGESKLRGSALVALGKLGQKLPEAVTKDMAIIQMLFNAMETEEPETRMAVQEALSIMLPAFKHLSSSNAAILEALLATSLESQQHLLRLIAVQYAGGIFHPTHVTSRYLLLLAAGDPKEEVKSEAMKLLYSNLPKSAETYDTESMEVDQNEKWLPDFVEMVLCISEKASTRMKSRSAVTYGTRTLPFELAAYSEMLSYLRLCLANSALLTPSLELLNEPELISSAARHYIEKLVSENGPVTAYLDLALELLAANPSKIPLQCVLEVVAGVPKLSAVLLSKLDMFKTLQHHNKEDVREMIAQIIAVIVCESYDTLQVDALIHDLCRNLKDKPLEQQHGFILTLGYTVGRIVRNHLSGTGNRMELEKSCRSQLSPRLSTATSLVIDFLFESPHPMTLSAACLAVGEMGRCGPLLDSTGDSSRAVDKLLGVVGDAKINGRIREKAALAAGYLSLGELEYPRRKYIIEHFLTSTEEMKDVEIQFTIGEALVCAALGVSSPESRDRWTVKEKDFTEPENAPAQLDFLLEELLNKYVSHLNPNIKQATSIWLLALVKSCPQRPEMKERLLRIQRAFMTLLAEGGDLVQDIASKGLGLVFECCTVEQQNLLASELVGSLTTDRRPAMQVTKDTKVFEEGSLGANPSGGQLSTYRELCSLATDMNQPDLIYKFMHLANHNAIWNSKKGAAFGFGSIAKKAGQQLAPHLPVIIPKLYRYQFDPSPRIRQSMSSIWEALVSEQSKTIDLYFQPILDDLLTHLTSNLWRNRESSCMGLADLLRGRTLENALDKLVPIWSTLFRVVDDIKESVRKAAQTALRAISKMCIKMVDVDAGKVNSKRTVELLLPVLLQEGLTSGVEEVQAITLETLIKVVKSAGNLVGTHLAPLISALLEATQVAEGQSLNYLSVRLGNQLATQEKLDLARISAAKSSNLYETIQHCIQYVNQDNAPGIVAALVDLLKGCQGITTKGCAAHVICLLTQQCQNDIQPFAGRLMAVLVKGLGDRNVALKKTYAIALGHLVRVAKDSSVVKLLETLENRYLEAEDEDSRLACMHTLQAMVRYNPDVVKNHSSQTVPIVFLGKHTFKTPETTQLIQSWEELWMDIVPGTEAGLRMYSNDIIGYLQRAIVSPSWKLKSQSAAAIGSMANSLKSHLNLTQRAILFRILLDGLAGRTWEGKEHLLHALASLVATETVDDVVLRDEIIGVVLREAKKEALPYRRHAIQALGQVAEALQSDIFPAIYEMLQPLFETKEDEMEEEEKEETAQREMLDLHEAAVLALGRAFSSDATAQGNCWKMYMSLLRAAAINTTRQVQLSIVTSLLQVAGRMTPLFLSDFLKEANRILAPSLDVANYSALRIEALKVLIIVLKKIPDCDPSTQSGLMDVVREVYSLRVEEFLRDTSPEVKSRADEAKRLMAE